MKEIAQIRKLSLWIFLIPFMGINLCLLISQNPEIFENLGGKVLGSVSKKLNILVVGSSKPTKKKIDKAKELNIKIYSENDWYKLLNI